MRQIFHICSFCVATLFFFVAIFVNDAQAQRSRVVPNSASLSIAARKAASENARRKGGGELTLVPLSGTPDFFGAAVHGGDPCGTAQPINFGQGIAGSLANTDCRLDDQSYADFYTFYGVAGEQIQIDLGSGAFDSYLGVANESGSWVVEDDDGGGGFNARIVATLPETGDYIILANSALPNEFGAYNLSLSGGPQCSFAFTPPSMDVPAAGGTFTFEVATGPRCYWSAGAGEYYVTTTSSGLGNGTVRFIVAPNTVNQSRQTSIFVRNAVFYVRQAARACIYTLGPPSVNVGPASSSGTFTVSAPQGCFWSAQAQGSFLSATGWANGNGTVNYAVQNNNGPNRSGTIVLLDQQSPAATFTVNQTGLNCTYSVSPIQLTVPAAGAAGSFVVNTQPGCTWFIDRNQNWILIQTGAGSGPATVPFTVQPQTARTTRSAVIQFYYNNGTSGYSSTYIDQAARNVTAVADFDGDGRAEIAVRRPSDNTWYLLRSAAGYTAMTFGVEGDQMTPADYDGDGRSDIAVFRPSENKWYIAGTAGGFYTVNWGTVGDIPVPADYDGDLRADVAVYRPSTGTWYIRGTTAGFITTNFGTAEDKPQPGDYDGDGRADIAVRRPSDNVWYMLRTSQGYTARAWGQAGDLAAPADYDGDGKIDLAVFRPTNGTWYVFGTSRGIFTQIWGEQGDIPAAADYDGDTKADISVFRPSTGTWYIVGTTAGIIVANFGQRDDTPIESVYNR